MNYAQTIDYLFTKLPMYSRIGAAAYKEDLTNTIDLCEFLGNPQKKFKTIHVAGTNGKGSVSHMLAAIFATAGYKTGLYTSPHLKDFRERIKINGEMVSEQFVIDFTEKIAPKISEIEPSFFEITVAMAFDHFATEAVDIAIIEVGLGGRLDSTNIITPELSVITNIGWDHMNMLGDTLAKIAIEKAGIIKQNVPVVIGETLPETLPVFESIAKERNAPLILASNTREVINWKWEKTAEKHILQNVLVAEIETNNQREQFRLDLPGIYQLKNLVTVLACCDQLTMQGWDLPQEKIKEALEQAKKLTGLHGRWEVIQYSPTVVLDVAHNIDGIQQLLQQIQVTQHDQLHIIYGMVKDKEIDSILKLLPKQARYYFTKAQIPRALPQDELERQALKYGLNGQSFSNVNTALYAASVNAKKNDLVIICGSIFLVGELSAATINEIWGGAPTTFVDSIIHMLGGIH